MELTNYGFFVCCDILLDVPNDVITYEKDAEASQH